ncbi:HD domain-containing protein [Dialister sp.]|uniref:HD domain-containing protein n=1 Tax=Dialister sp. TaxID=1955814 RepID=UPI002E822F86|nr:HD domain-containing protein [Dialister sp.]MEE3453650.1 HD domain-containing protein [Dialister sp.]
METLLEKARKVAETCHKGQVDKAGKPYMNHLLTVSNGVKDLGETYTVVGMLHDTVEDTDMTVEKLRELFGDEVADAVSLLTHDDSLSYLDYVRKVKASGNPYAIAVKKSDLRNNMDLSRLNPVTEKDRKRVEKYRKAYEILDKK